MKRGFYTIMVAQFFSSLADNALFVAAVELLQTQGYAPWQGAALVPMFALFYVVLAPFVGAYADARPKGDVMLKSNSIKVVGCLMMLFGAHPLVAYAVVGLGAVAYSPAKYGILTELLPPSQLVKANGWIEGLTIASIILGVLLGGQLISPAVSEWLLSWDLPYIDTGINSRAKAAVAVLIAIYLFAAWFNTKIPATHVTLTPMLRDPKQSRWANLWSLVPDFISCNKLLWTDKLGQISLATTTLFWGVSGNLRYIVLAWSAAALGYGTSQASSLVGVVAVGTAVGAVLASFRMRLDQATRVMPLGIAMGIMVLGMDFIRNAWVAAPFLVLLGGLGGFLVVPMNALLQHRGARLMGGGRSIAVQNFNEQTCILALGGGYAFLTGMVVLNAFEALTGFGFLVAVVMWLIQKWHQRNVAQHQVDLESLEHDAQES